MILAFDKISRNDADKAGGKGASLGEMTQAGIAIPPGFVVLAETFEEFIDSNNLRAEIQTILKHLDHNNVSSIEHASEKIQELIRGGVISEKIQKEIQKHSKTIKTDYVAVRSSATAEDGADHAWAGQLDTYLNVSKTDIITKIQSCWASLFTPRALFYRSEKGLGDLHISVAVVVQSMVDAESAGVAFSVHPVTENTDEIVIEGSWGLGEAVVSGEVTPDSFVISKSSGEIISEHIAEKKKGIFRNTNGENKWRNIEKHEHEKPILTKKELGELSQLIIKIENHYGFPCDIEWAHSKGKVYILQARPITTLKNTDMSKETKNSSFINKNLEVWIERKQSIFSMTVFHELESKGMNKHLGGGFNTQICFMRNKVCSYIHEVGDLEKVIKNISRKLQNESKENIENYIKDMVFWEKKGLKILQEGQKKVMVSDKTMKKYLENYKEIGYWTTVVPYFLLEAIHTLEKTGKYKKLMEVCEKLRSNSLYPVLNEKITHSILEKICQKIGLEKEDSYYITWSEVMGGLRQNAPQEIQGVQLRKKKDNAFYREKNGEIVFLKNEKDIQILADLACGKDSSEVVQGKKCYPGKVTGKVKILRTREDMKDFKEGDILVSPNSNPSLMPCIKKCSAIITDEGGVSCHAAIISRELKIPCIIGTKNATKILKDGDLVEVDVENGIVKILEKKRNIFENNWQINATRNMPIWHNVLCAYGFTYNLSDYGVGEPLPCIFAVENGTHATMFSEPEIQKKGFLAMLDRCGDGDRVRDLRKVYEKYAQEVQENLKMVIKKPNKKNLDKFFSNYQRFTAGLWITTGFGRIGLEELMQELRNSGTPEANLAEIVSTITYPEEHTPLFQSQEDIIDIGIKVQKNKLKNTEKEIKNWLKKHKYIPVNYCDNPWSEEDAREQLESILEQDCEKLKKTFTENHKQKIQARDILRKKFNKKIRDLSDALAEATSLNEYRKSIFCRLSHDIRFFFAPLMHRLGRTDWRDAYYCTPEEINSMVEGKKLDIEKIKQDRERCVFVLENDEVLWADESQKEYFFNKIYKRDSASGEQTITGFSANRGKITGTVKIVLSSRDFHKVSRGDILVTTMTSVDFVPVMERAGAFVTNEGGITTHAAIVSREMNKPCIVGTKNATKILKDGDLVEVDADNGAVKILERKEKIQWAFTYDRLMSYQRIDLFHYGYCERLSQYFDVKIENELYRIKDGLVSVFYDELGHKKAFEKIRNLLTGKERAEWYKKIYLSITEDYKEFISFLNKGEKKRVNENLSVVLKEHMKHNRKISLSTWLLYSYIEEILSDVFQEILQQKGIKNWKEIFHILSQPDEMLPSDEWEYDIAQVVLLTREKQSGRIKTLALKYRSYGMYDVMFHGKSQKDIGEKAQKTTKESAKQIVENLKTKYKQQKKELEKIKNIEWSNDEKSLLKLYRLYANFKDWKNFHRERSSYQIREVYNEIAKKYPVEEEILYYMTEEEILVGIEKNKWLPKDLGKRKKNSALLFIQNKVENLTDIGELEELDKQTSIHKNSIAGTTAYPGKVTGKARIINSHEDLKKLKKGEIMISSTTRPDYLPFMTDVAGFITNEGGILSHAAILAREIKKPCIIGTKVATQVLKTGDMVEVNGENGTVRILEQKENYLDDKKLLSEGGRACYLYPNRIFCTRMNIPHSLWENHLMVISTSENHKVNWYFAVKDESEFDYTLEKVLKKPNILQEGEKDVNKFVLIAQKTLKKEYKNKKEVWEGYENFIRIYGEIAIVPTFVRQLDRAVVRSLREVITSEEDFATATYPLKRTYQRQEEILLLELRTKMGAKITPEILQHLHSIYSTYFTSGLGYFEEQVKTIANYKERLLGISKEEAQESLRKIQTEEKEMIKKKKELKKTFPEKADVIDIAGFIVYLKDHYKFQINKVQHYSEGLWKNIASITGYTENFLRDLTPEEIQNLLQNNTIDEEAIIERIACHAYVYNEKGEPELIIGKKAQDFIQKYLKTDNEQKKFSGRIACKGHGTGKAKIILGTRDFHKMEQGDILVVMNTSPDFVPIMKKAAAIVAEEGGITGHVSVVSREFGIPSVVGIKQITSIIQDGEIIEVDAERGIVIRHNN